MSAALEALKFVGPKLGAQIFAEYVDRNFDKRQASLIKAKYLGTHIDYYQEFDNLKTALTRVDSVITETRFTVMFSNYHALRNSLASKLTNMIRPKSDEDRKRAASQALRSDGLMSLINQMGAALFDRRDGNALIEKLSDILVGSHADVYDYVEKLEAVGEDFFAFLTAAQTMRECALPIADEDPDDVVLDDALWSERRANYQALVADALRVRAHVDRLVGQSIPIVIQHQQSRKWLTVNEVGGALSGEGLRDLYKPTVLDGAFMNEKSGWPQVFLHERGYSKRIKYYFGTMKPIIGDGDPALRREFVIDDDAQLWIIEKVVGGGRVRLRFRNKKTNKYIGGNNRDRVYLTDRKNIAEWQVVLDRRVKAPVPEWGSDFSVFLRNNVGEGRMLDGDGERIYTLHSAPSYDNPYMKWRLIDYTVVGKGTKLKPGDVWGTIGGVAHIKVGQDRLIGQSNGVEKWISRTRNDLIRREVGSIEFRGDGDMVVIDKNGRQIWSSGTANVDPDAEWRLYNDGRLAYVSRDGSIRWKQE